MILNFKKFKVFETKSKFVNFVYFNNHITKCAVN